MSLSMVFRKLAFLSVFTVLMTSCGNGGGGGSNSSFTIGGTVSGLLGTLVLQNNSTDDLTVNADGSFEFSQKINNGKSYNVTVLTHPNSPVQTCTITNPGGTVSGVNVTNVSISCIAGNAFTVSGTVSGLVGSGLVLQNNGADNRAISASNGTNVDFTFPAPVLNGKTYLVTVATQPSSPTQTCTVSNESGTVKDSNIIDIAVTCVTNGFTVGGTVSGLSSPTSMVLKNNGSDPLTINSDGEFTFSTGILDFRPYRVAVSVQPTNGQSCRVDNKSGTINGTNITNITIVCGTGILSVGGTVSGIAGTGLVLQNNGGDDKPISADGSFTFGTLLVDEAEYLVTVLRPSGSPNVGCSVANGSGVIRNPIPVTDVVVTCLQYRTIQSLENATESSGKPTLVYDTSGNVTAVWDQKDNSDINKNQYANRYDAGTKTWGTAEIIGIDNLGGNVSTSRKVVVDSSGNVIVIWWQSNGSLKNLWANRYASGSWGTAEIILDATNLLNMSDPLPVPSVVVDGSGNVTVVWSQEDSTGWNQWANKFTVGSGWGPATKIEVGSGSVSDPITVIDGTGNVTAIWGQKNGSRWDQWANRYTGSWGTAKLIETEDLGDVAAASAVIDPSGNVTVVWVQSNGTWDNQWANRYSAGTGTWGKAKLIETENLGNVLTATIKADNNGNVMVTWPQKADGRFSQWANVYTQGASWGSAKIIEGVAADSGDAFVASLGVDAFGNFTAIWAQNVDTTPLRKNLWANRFVNGNWVGAEEIESDDVGNVSGLIRSVLVDENGNVTTVWTQHNGSINNLVANRYNFVSGTWEGAGLIESRDTAVQTASFSSVIDTTGNVTVLWFHRNIANTGFERWVNRYIVSIGWGSAQRIDGSLDDSTNSAANIGDVVVDKFGQVTAAWSQSNGVSSHLKANRID